MVQERLPARYRVLEEVGQGGMAVVYRAHDEALKREVAVKVLHAHLLAEGESKTRLEREARAVAKLHHDNIVQIFDYSGIDSAASYIVTEFIDGQTLKQFMTPRKPPPPEVAALIAIEIGSALLHAHSLGIIHRDVKPDNVMVRKDGVLKLMDFGVAQIMDLERMTVTGQLLGSPAYMAPEILEGRPLDVRTDVFSVGIMLYQMATGALPFSGRNPHEVLKRIAEGKFADPRTLNRLIPDRLARIIARALAKKPEERYPTVAALVDDLQSFVADAGLTSARGELQGYFGTPDQYVKDVVPRMLGALVANGKREREARRTARALELWNRALALDPSNREVLSELKRLESRQQLKRGSLIALGVAVLGGGAFLGLRNASEPSITPPVVSGAAVTAPATPTAPATAPARKPPALAAAPGPRPDKPPEQPRTGPPAAARSPGPPPVKAVAQVDPEEGKPGGRRPAVAVRPPAARVKPPTQKRVITLVPYPRAAVSVDGGTFDEIGPGTNTVELDWERNHTLVFRNECCWDEEKKLGPDFEPENDRLAVLMRPRAAKLNVSTQPPAKGKVLIREIDIGDEDTGTPINLSASLGEEVAIQFAGDRDLFKRLELTVVPEGKQARIQVVEIQANKKRPVIVKLD
jgi:eukaryotic-like serine/threonine-protein kinase